MTSYLQRRALATGLGLVVIALAALALERSSNRPAPPAAAPGYPRSGWMGADWQQRGLLSEPDYGRLRGIGRSVTQTRKVSDQELDWLLATMGRSRSSIMHARVLGILSALGTGAQRRQGAASQKGRIRTAIAPLLPSPDLLERRYAQRVQSHLALYR
jgi:hypothetical protein